MNKFQALHSFWNSFGVPAYEASTVPDSVSGLYITYTAAVDRLDNTVVVTASLWQTDSNSWTSVSQLAEQISDELIQVKSIPMDIGYMYLTRGTPFAQRMSDEIDTTRRIVINVIAEYLAP